eukprot:1895237-Rhodomonas_salina.1
MPSGGGGFAGGGPGCWMCWEGNGVRQGFSGGVPGHKRRGESGMRPGGARGAVGVGFGAGGAGGLGHGLGHVRQTVTNKCFNSVVGLQAVVSK